MISRAGIIDPGYNPDLVAADEVLPEFRETSILDRSAGALHKVEIEMEVVNTEETQPENLFRFQQMPNVSARITAARFAGASFVHRPGLSGEFRVF
jgi:hypothetical protein